MYGAKSCDELEVYQLAVSLRREVVKLTARYPVNRDYKFVDQIRNAARGGPRNISEGFSRFVPTEFRHFLSYAKASIDETRTHITDGYESGYFTDQESKALLELIRRTLAAIRGLMSYLESPDAMHAYRAIVRARMQQPHKSRKTRRKNEP